MGLVIVAIVATAGYIGYHASQGTEVVEEHGIAVLPEALEGGAPSVNALQEIVIPARL